MKIKDVTDLGVMHICNASFQEVEARMSRDQGSPREISKLDYLKA